MEACRERNFNCLFMFVAARDRYRVNIPFNCNWNKYVRFRLTYSGRLEISCPPFFPWNCTFVCELNGYLPHRAVHKFVLIFYCFESIDIKVQPSFLRFARWSTRSIGDHRFTWNPSFDQQSSARFEQNQSPNLCALQNIFPLIRDRKLPIERLFTVRRIEIYQTSLYLSQRSTHLISNFR